MKISVIIPTFNRAALLVRALDSVFAQTRPADEVIVVDDGSTDDTRVAVERYPRSVIYRYQANARPGAARNHGHRVSGGDALLFLDSDDLLKPSALERLETTLQNNPEAALAYCACEFIGGNDEPIPSPDGHPFQSGAVWEHLVRGNFVRSPGSALIRRSHLEQVGPWLTRATLGVNEDWELFLRLAENAPFAFLDESLFSYRVQDGSLGSNELENYRWALWILNSHIDRHTGNADRLASLSTAYDFFYEATTFRWKKAIREDFARGRWRIAISRFSYLLKLRSRHAKVLAVLQPHRQNIGLTRLEKGVTVAD